MASLKDEFKKFKDWIVVQLNPNRDMLTALASKLSANDRLIPVFKSAHLNLSFLGLGVEFDLNDGTPIYDTETAIERMLAAVKENHKRLLIIIDEISNTQYMRDFASAFQIFMSDKNPIFLLAAGLFENIRDLQNTDNLTFLYRTPRIELDPLNINSMMSSYQNSLEISRDDARKMAALSLGYPYAFQTLGYFSWEHNGDYIAAFDQYRQQLEDYVYDKIWSELSRRDKQVLNAIVESSDGKVSEIRKTLGMKTNEFSVYRKRLLNKGIVNGNEYGYVSLSLPLFSEFVKSKYY